MRVPAITIITSTNTRDFNIRLHIIHQYSEKKPPRFNMYSSLACRSFANNVIAIIPQTWWVLLVMRLHAMLYISTNLSIIHSRRSNAIMGILPKMMYNRTTMIAPAHRLRSPSTKLVVGFTQPALLEVATTPVTLPEGQGKHFGDTLLMSSE